MTYICEFLEEDEIKLFSYGTRVNNEERVNQIVSDLFPFTESYARTNNCTNNTNSTDLIHLIPNSTETRDYDRVELRRPKDTYEYA